MPFYTFNCKTCGEFEKRAGYDDFQIKCSECGAKAKRRPFSRILPAIIEGRTEPDTAVEAQQKLFKNLRKSGWDEDRAVEGVRKNTKLDKEGLRHFDATGMVKA